MLLSAAYFIDIQLQFWDRMLFTCYIDVECLWNVLDMQTKHDILHTTYSMRNKILISQIILDWHCNNDIFEFKTGSIFHVFKKQVFISYTSTKGINDDADQWN